MNKPDDASAIPRTHIKHQMCIYKGLPCVGAGNYSGPGEEQCVLSTITLSPAHSQHTYGKMGDLEQENCSKALGQAIG